MASSESVVQLAFSAREEAIAAKAKGSLSTGGGGGTFENMDARFTALEARATKSEETLQRISETLSDIRADLASKPTTNGLWGMIATVIGVALAIAFGTFAVAEYSSSRNISPQATSTPTIIVVPQIPAQPADRTSIRP